MQRERAGSGVVHRARAEHEDDEGVELSDRQPLIAGDEPATKRAADVALSIADPESKDKPKQEAERKPGKRRQRGPVIFLNGLRGLAALMVVQQHLQYTPEIRLGSASVDVFFVLSAFLLTMLFERKVRQMLAQRANRVQWLIMLLDYLSKRFFRVYPLLVVVAYALQYMTQQQRAWFYLVKNPNYRAVDVITFKFEERWFVFWSLPIEIAYYFLIPPFVGAVLALRRFWWLMALPLYAWIIHEGIHTKRAHHQTLRPHLPTFVAGSLAAIVYNKIDQWMETNDFEFSKWHRVVIRVFELAIFSLFMSILFRGLLFHSVITNPYLHIEGFPFVSVPVSVLIVIEMLLPSALSRFLEWNFLCYAGKISFSLYLLHTFVVNNPAVKRQPDKYDRFFLDFGGAMLLSTVSYWAVEYPSQLAAQHISKMLNRIAARSITSAPQKH